MIAWFQTIFYLTCPTLRDAAVHGADNKVDKLMSWRPGETPSSVIPSNIATGRSTFIPWLSVSVYLHRPYINATSECLAWLF